MVLAAYELFAESGPADVSLRTLAARIGCSHTLLSQQFGSKAGLEAAVVQRLADEVGRLTAAQCRSDDWPIARCIAGLRAQPAARKLLIRCALGEFDLEPLVRGHNIAMCLAGRIEMRRGGSPDDPGPEARAAAFGALSLTLGLISVEDWLIAGSRTTPIPGSTRDAAVARAAELVAALGVTGEVDLSFGTRTPPDPGPPRDLTLLDSRTALIEATVELYSARGRGGLSTREIADRAVVNQGLIYHHFGSREDLLMEAFQYANRPLQAVVDMAGPFDIEAAAANAPRSSSLPFAARLAVNGTDIRSVRRTFPVFDRMLAQYDRVPTGARTTGLDDPRLAVMATASVAMGVVIWADPLARMLGIPPTADPAPLVARIDRHLLALGRGHHPSR